MCDLFQVLPTPYLQHGDIAIECDIKIHLRHALHDTMYGFRNASDTYIHTLSPVSMEMSGLVNTR